MTHEVVHGSRTARWVVAPTLIVLFLALAWSGLWFYASHVADRTITEWTEREAQFGRIHSCASRSVGGFPFRFELRCANPTVELRGGSVPAVLKARELLAVAQIYRPDLLIAEVTGPMTAGNSANRKRSPLIGRCYRRACAGFRPRRSGSRSCSTKRGLAKRLARTAYRQRRQGRVSHQRASNAETANAAFDIISRLTGTALPAWPLLASGPLSAEVSAVLRGVNDLLPKPIPVRLREWQASGGRLELTQMRVTQGDALGVASGAVGLTSEGRLEGAIDLKLAGFDQLVRGLSGQGQGIGQLGFLGLSALAGRTELEGKRAIAVPLRFDRGAFFLGPIRVGQTGAFF